MNVQDKIGRMLRPIYNTLLDKHGQEESQYSLPWPRYKQTPPQPCQENNQVKILWDIPWHLEQAPKDGANRPDISVLDKTTRSGS